MTQKKKETKQLQDQYAIGYWTEYYGTNADDYVNGIMNESQNFSLSVTGTISLSARPNISRIRLGSKVLGFCDGSTEKTEDFENNSHPYRVFRVHEYKELKTDFRYTNPQRFIKAYNNNSFSQNGNLKGAPIIIDSQVPQPPNYILALNNKLTSQWSIKKLYSSNNLPLREPALTDPSWRMFQEEPFKLWAPFAYNFVDSFVNKMWSDIKLSESSIISNNPREIVAKQILWFDQEPKAEVPFGNHLGKGILPLAGSIDEYVTVPTSSINSPYLINSTTKGPVHIGLGSVNLQPGTNTVASYHTAVHGVTTAYLDVYRNLTESYFDDRGLLSTRNFIFYNQGPQENLSNAWLFAYPNEHRFKSLARLNKPKRSGNPSWGNYSNSKYSVQGWEIPESLTEKDSLGSINDFKIGTLFWKFDSGIVNNKYFPTQVIDTSTYLPLPVTDSSNILRSKGVQSHIITESVLLSPTIVMSDFFGTPKGFNYQSVVSSSVKSKLADFPLYPKLDDMYNISNVNMQFSLSFSPTYPKIQDIYKAFFGFGDGIMTNLSEYVTDSFGINSKWSEQKVYQGDEYAHRKKVVWGKGKTPSFKSTYQFLHSMTYAIIPLPVYENPVSFSVFTGSVPVVTEFISSEPDIINLDKMKDQWPIISTDLGPKFEKPLWWEGPCVVSGPILRGYKYGLFDCLPRVPTAIFRRNSFGNLRDMLEQRLFFATKFSQDSSEIYTVTTQFVTGSVDEQIWNEYNDWQVGDMKPVNEMDSGLYEIHSRVGKPFNESGWV